jgi:hypothetical protein
VHAKKTMHAAHICDEGIPLDEPIAAVAVTAMPFRRDDWPAQQRVRSLARELKRPTSVAGKPPQHAPVERRRLDPPQDSFSSFDRQSAAIAAEKPSFLPANTLPPPNRNEGSQVVAWLIVTVGALALSAGVGLIAWSLSNNVMTYWNLALGLALGGEGTLILGLVVVVSRLWRHSRYAAGKLHDVQARLGQLQQTAEILTSRSGGAPAFYAELARGSNPHMLLANLKGQLDQLAARLGSR